MERRGSAGCMPRGWQVIVLGAVALGSSLPGIARASCNTVPAAARAYYSTTGAVDRRLAFPFVPAGTSPPRPDEWVTVTLPAACVPSGPVFDPAHPAAHQVTLAFLLSAGPQAVAAQRLEVVDARTLRFLVPDAGLAGPVEITVTNPAGKIAAVIGPLHEPSSSCDVGPQNEDTTFETFTVLPRPNALGALAAKTAPLVMTVDGQGNLLIPLDHSAVLPAPQRTPAPLWPVAIFEFGEIDLPAFGTPGSISLRKALAKAVKPADETLEHQLVRAFTEHGRTLPPFLALDGDGAVFGTADAPRSVLRVARYDPNDGQKELYDVTGRVDQHGTIVVAAAGAHYGAGTCHPAPLLNLHTTDDVVTYARDERIEGDLNGDGDQNDLVVHINRRAQAGSGCGLDTRRAVLEDSPRGEASLDADGTGVAFLEPRSAGGVQVRAYRAAPLAYPTAKSTPLADPAPDIDRRNLVVSGRLVFFRQQATDVPSLRVLDLKKLGTASELRAKKKRARRAVVAARRALVVGPPDAGAGGDVVSGYDGDGDWLQQLPVAGSAIATGQTLAAVTVVGASGGSDLRLARFGKKSFGPWHSTGRAATDVAVVGWCDQSKQPCERNPDCPGSQACISRAVFLEPQPASTPGAPPSLLHVYQADASPIAQYTPAPAEDFVARGGIVVFRTSRSGGPGTTLSVLDLRVDPPRICDTGQTALRSWVGLGWRDRYEIRGNDVLFLTSESEQGADLDGDPSNDAVVLQIYDVDRCGDSNVLASVDAASLTADPPAVLPDTQGGAVLRVRGGARESQSSAIVFADQDGDGVPDPFDVCAAVPNPKQIDDDLDGLGDGVASCDPSYCTPFLPPPVPRLSPAARRCAAAIAAPASRYLEAREALASACLTRFVAASETLPAVTKGRGEGAAAVAARRRSAPATDGRAPRTAETLAASATTPRRDRRAGALDPDALCLGSFAGDAENRPLLGPLADATTVRLVEEVIAAEAALRATVAADCGQATGRIVRAYGDGVSAMSRVAWGLTADAPAASADSACHETASRAGIRYVAAVTRAMQDCLSSCAPWPRSRRALAARCVGSLMRNGGDVTRVAPTDRRTARAVAEAELAFEDAVAHCPRPVPVAAAAGARGGAATADPRLCVAWRRAVDIALTTLAPRPVAPEARPVGAAGAGDDRRSPAGAAGAADDRASIAGAAVDEHDPGSTAEVVRQRRVPADRADGSGG